MVKKISSKSARASASDRSAKLTPTPTHSRASASPRSARPQYSVSTGSPSLALPSKTSSYTSPRSAKIAIFLLRIALGWLFLYSGITKILNPEFTSAGFLGTAKTFPALFDWFASADNIGWVNTLNSWGQALIGLSLITGTFVRLSSFFGAILMLLYYFPGLDFPTVKNGFIIDDHIIYIFIFAIFITERSGQFWGLDYYVNKKVKNWWV